MSASVHAKIHPLGLGQDTILPRQTTTPLPPPPSPVDRILDTSLHYLSATSFADGNNRFLSQTQGLAPIPVHCTELGLLSCPILFDPPNTLVEKSSILHRVRKLLLQQEAQSGNYLKCRWGPNLGSTPNDVMLCRTFSRHSMRKV